MHAIPHAYSLLSWLRWGRLGAAPVECRIWPEAFFSTGPSRVQDQTRTGHASAPKRPFFPPDLCAPSSLVPASRHTAGLPCCNVFTRCRCVKTQPIRPSDKHVYSPSRTPPLCSCPPWLPTNASLGPVGVGDGGKSARLPSRAHSVRPGSRPPGNPSKSDRLARPGTSLYLTCSGVIPQAKHHPTSPLCRDRFSSHRHTSTVNIDDRALPSTTSRPRFPVTSGV